MKLTKLYITTIIALLIISYGCRTGVYVSSGPHSSTFIKLCKNGKFIRKYSGWSMEEKYAYGYWMKKNDTIVLKIAHPTPKFFYDSLATVKEKVIDKIDKTCFKVSFPDTLFGFNVYINKKEYKSTSDSLCIPRQKINSFKIKGMLSWMEYIVKNPSTNYFIITFKKNYLPPQPTENVIIEPSTKFIKKGKKLFPLDPYTLKPTKYYLKRKFIDNYKLYKEIPFCKNKKTGDSLYFERN